MCTRNGRDAYMLLFDHFLGPNNVGNMASATANKLTGTLHNGKKKRFTWERYVTINNDLFATIETFNCFEMIAISIVFSATTSLCSSASSSAIIALVTADVTTIVIMSFPFLFFPFSVV
jgi:hypothetical protein